jgi:hypothetical protein
MKITTEVNHEKISTHVGRKTFVTLSSEYVLLAKFDGEYKIFDQYDKMQDIINHLQKRLDDARDKKSNEKLN